MEKRYVRGSVYFDTGRQSFGTSAFYVCACVCLYLCVYVGACVSMCVSVDEIEGED